jgi:hypothetical protein
MMLWIEWYEVIQYLHAACSRHASAMWMTLCIAGFCIRDDLRCHLRLKPDPFKTNKLTHQKLIISKSMGAKFRNDLAGHF